MSTGHHPMGCQHKLYMLTCEEFDELRAAARGVCARCGRSDRPIVVDHDHSIGDWAVRGMVCHQCNAIMALVDRGERPAVGLTAEYLAKAWHLSRPPKARKFPRARCMACGGNVHWSRKTGRFFRHQVPDGATCPQSRRPVPGAHTSDQRTLHVQSATTELARRLTKFQQEHDLTEAEMFGALREWQLTRRRTR